MIYDTNFFACCIWLHPFDIYFSQFYKFSYNQLKVSLGVKLEVIWIGMSYRKFSIINSFSDK